MLPGALDGQSFGKPVIRALASALTTVLVLQVAACGAGAASISRSPTLTVVSPTAGQVAPLPAARARTASAKPIGLPAFQGGAIVYTTGNDPSLLPSTRRLLDHLTTLNINSVAFAYPLYQSGWTATDVHADPQKTPSTDLLRASIEWAHKRRLAVVLRPLIDDAPLMQTGHWRGQLQPTSVPAWFASYSAEIIASGRMASDEGVAAIDIGTELASLQTYTQQWLQLIQSLRTVYSGKITYSSNWDVSVPAFASALDFISVDGFFPLSAPDSASTEQLVRAWQQWSAKLGQIRSTFAKPVVLTELGTTSEVGSYRSPFNWKHAGGLSLEAQRRYYEASCRALKPVVSGMYWWAYYPWFDLAAGAQDPGYTPMGKPAEHEIKNCYQ